jgi:hypothetical protein
MGVVGRLDQYASMLATEFDDYSMSENLVSYSTYTASNWINNFPAGASITTGITAPDGTNTAVRLTCTNTTNALLRVNIPSLTPNGTDTYTTSFYVRKISGTGGAFTDLGDGNPSADYSSQLVTNQWVRVTVSGVPTATAKTFLDLFSDNNTNYVLDFWGVQLETGSVATDYTPTTTTAISRVLPATTNTNITGLGTYYSSGFDENVGFTTFLSANVFPPYDLVYDEFSGTSFGAGQGRYMRQNTDKSVIVYNEIDEVTDLFGRGIVRDGLVLDLDAGISASYPGSGTTWTDLTSRGNNGTLVLGPTYSSANGGSIVFDGTNDYVNTVTATSLGINSASTSFTISVWFKTTGTLEYYLFDNYNGNANIDISLRIDGGTFEVYMAATGLISSVQFGSGYNNGAWHNFTLTWNGSNTINAYADGINIGSNTTTITGSFESNAAFRIGFRPVGGVNTFYFPGHISQVSVYNRALRAAEILQNYNALKHRFGL